MHSLRHLLAAAGVRALAGLTAALLALAAAAQAAPILSPSTTTYGGIVNATNFVTGQSTAGFSGNGWPSVQGPSKAVDGQIGPGSKYLNFNILNTALIFSGTAARVADRLELWVAEDAVERDPTSYILYGTNNLVPNISASGSTFPVSSFTQISSGSLALPATRDLTADATGFSQSIPIPNTTAYASYLLVFPTVKNAPTTANSMQISEVQLYDGDLIGLDSFDYTDGPLAGKNGGTFWNYKNTAPAGRSATPSTWVNIAGGTSNVTGGRLVTTNHGWARRNFNGASESDGAINETNVEKAVYARVTVTTGATLPSYFGIASYNLGAERMFLGKRVGSSNFGYEIIGGANANGTTAVPVNATFTLVYRLDFSADRIQLYLNPRLNLPLIDPANAATLVADAAYTVTDSSTALRLASGDGGPSITWDDFAVATSWAALSTIVTTLADEDDGPASLATPADISLRESVKYSPTGSLITFAPGLSGGTITLNHLDGDMEIPGALSIDASALPGGLTVSGNNTSRHFFVDSGKSLTLRGLTFTRGNGVGGPNAIGGSIVSVGTLNLFRCTLTGNASTSEGGAIYSIGSLRATDSTFSENTAGNIGGGVLLFSGMAELTGCTLSGNTASNGGAFWQQGATTATLSHCTVAGNRSTGGGSIGGIGAVGGTLNLQHCTISQNSGNGGLGVGGLGVQAPATVNVQSCIIAGNAAPGGNRPDIFFFSGTLNASGTSLIGSNESVTAQFPTGPLAGINAAPLDPKLSPLGSYGGPTQTMPPLAGSPAIDAAGATSTFTTDQRGLPRVVDGNNSGTAQTDIGAVESAFRFVTNNGNSGSGSLRQAVLDAAAAPGWEAIAFVPALNAGTISLTSTDPGDANTGIVITDTDGVAIDASSLPGGLTITKPAGNWRLFRVGDGSRLSLHQLTLTGGSLSGDFGGAVTNASGTLSLSDCTLTGNTAMDGGAISSNGASIASGHFTEVRRCTFTGNSATGTGPNGRGGAIFNNNGKTTVLFSTISGNTVPGPSGGGIGSLGDTATLTEVTSSIVSGNTGGDVVFTNGATNSFRSRGHNLIGTGNGNPAFNQTGDLINNAAPLLAPLANYGGPTRTMPPLRGSPAIDASAAASAGPTDQRGLPRVVDGNNSGTAQTDIGAVESAFRFVTTTTDNASTPAAGSLRKALIDAAAQPGWEAIAFASSVTPHITLASEILITDPAGVTLDASDRPTGLVIDAGPGTNRHFRIASGTTATFQRLRLYGGGGTGGETTEVGWGGSIRNQGTLTLRECTITDCTTPANAVGGAILNRDPGVLSLERCSLYRNSATAGGGAIHHHSAGLLTLTACTIAHNTAGFEAGGINSVFTSPVTLTHCTITGNAVTQTGANGIGGVRGVPSGFVTVRDSIIAGNTDANFPGTPNINTGFINPAGSVNLTSGNPNLATLGDYGGPTWTMPPMPGSPAIDAALASTGQTDQRGAPRLIDGNLDMDDFSDIGAVEMPRPVTVTTTADENNTPAGPQISLREAIRDADAGASILFASSFNGEPADKITLSQALGEITFTKGLILNASANPGGVTIDGGPGTNRIFYLPAGTGAYLQRLTLTGGGGGGAMETGSGGAILCNGATVGLADCALFGNTASNFGGAIRNSSGTLMLDRCLLTGNTAQDGGAISNRATDLTGPAISAAVLTNCTITNNTASSSGGGVRNVNGRATLLHCTINGNTAPSGQASGVFSFGDTLTRASVQNCLIAGNNNASDVSSGSTNSFLSLGGNLIGSGNATGAFNQLHDGTGQTAASLRLAPLADYGGPTQTIALRPGSPARDNAIATPITTDQRGFPIVLGPKDSGAYEAGNFFLENFNVFAQEFLPHTATDPQRARAFDFDGDGQSNEAEWLAVTGPGTASSAFRPGLFLDNGDLKISFPTFTGRTYRLQQSSTLLGGSWTDSGLPAKSGNNDLQNFIVTPTTTPARRFFRVVVSQ